jgi:hypothetical protein
VTSTNRGRRRISDRKSGRAREAPDGASGSPGTGCVDIPSYREGKMSEKKVDDDEMPVAGPHAKPELMDEDKTPGTGMLPPVGKGKDGNQAPSG